MQSLFVEVEASEHEVPDEEGPQGESSQATGALAKHHFNVSRFCLTCCMEAEPPDPEALQLKQQKRFLSLEEECRP